MSRRSAAMAARVGEDGFDRLAWRAPGARPVAPVAGADAVVPAGTRSAAEAGDARNTALCHELAHVVEPSSDAACPHDCPDTCAMRVTVEDGRAVARAGRPGRTRRRTARCAPRFRATPSAPTTPSACCSRCKRVGPKGSGSFEPVELGRGARRHRARACGASRRATREAIVPYSYAGTMGLVQGESMAARFFHRLGASLLDRTICSSAGGEALAATYGAKVGMHVEHYAESRLILIWGSNSIASNLHFWTFAQAGQARRRASWSASTRAAPRPPTSATSTSRCCPGTDGALALGADARADRPRLARPRLHRRATSNGWPRAARARAAVAARARRRRSAASTADAGARAGARLRHARAPAAIRLNYGMQRVRGGGNAVRLIAMPAVPGRRLAPPRRRPAAVELGLVPRVRDDAALQRPDLLAGRRPRTINMSTIGDDLLRESGSCADGRLRAADRGARRLQQQPGRGGARVAEGRARLRARRPLHRRARALPDRHRRPCRLRAAGHDAARAPRRPHELRPHLRADQRAGDRAARRGASRTRRSSASWPRAWASTTPCFARRRRDAARARAFRHDGGSTSTRCARTAGSSCRCPRRRSPTAASRRRVASAASTRPGSACPTTCPTTSRPRSDAGARGALPARDDLAAGAQLPQLELRQRDEPARHRGRAAARDPPGRRRARAASPTADCVRVFNDRGSYRLQGGASSARARPGVVNGLGVWWRKLGARRHATSTS